MKRSIFATLLLFSSCQEPGIDDSEAVAIADRSVDERTADLRQRVEALEARRSGNSDWLVNGQREAEIARQNKRITELERRLDYMEGERPK